MARIIRYLAAALVIGFALPTAASLLMPKGAAQSLGFPFTLGTTSIAALSTVVDLLGLNSLSMNGYSTASTTDPIIDYHCAGVATSTTGTISSGSPSLVVASASGWSVGMGIAVANAGSGGNTELITTVSNIAGTTFTLAANAVTTATTQAVNHDDTSCLTNAVASGKNVHLRAGTYNTTSLITMTAPLMFTCEGSAVDPHLLLTGYLTSARQGAIIQNRGKTNSMFKINTNFVTIRDCAFTQAAGITPTAGYAITVSHVAPDYITGIRIEDNVFLNTYGGLEIGNGGDGHVISITVANNYFWTTLAPTFGYISINNPAPAGDVRFRGNEVIVENAAGLYIGSADVNSFTDNKFNGCNGTSGCVNISGTVINQTFVNNSFEGLSSGSLIFLSAGTGLTFVGGECGAAVDCFNWSGTASGAIIGMNFSNLSGAFILNTSSGAVLQKGNYAAAGNPNDTAPDGTASANCASGVTAGTVVVKGGVVTHC